MIEIKRYRGEEPVRRQLLQVLLDVDNDFVPPLSKRRSLEFWLEIFDQGSILYAKAPLGDAVAGFLAYYPALDPDTYQRLLPYVNIAPVVSLPGSRETFREAYLHFIAVTPAYRGRQVSSALLAQLLQEVQEQGISRLRVITWSTNTGSLNLYKKFNFTVFHRVPDDRGEGIDSVYLEVTLAVPPAPRYTREAAHWGERL
jgi:ribosomal protein S18 acetylase RimI-like enzyme